MLYKDYLFDVDLSKKKCKIISQNKFQEWESDENFIQELNHFERIYIFRKTRRKGVLYYMIETTPSIYTALKHINYEDLLIIEKHFQNSGWDVLIHSETLLIRSKK